MTDYYIYKKYDRTIASISIELLSQIDFVNALEKF